MREAAGASAAGVLRGLVLASHPLPTLAVTAFGTAYGAVAAGLRDGVLVLLALALLAGQLSIGWCNDALDAGRDRAAGRGDKPAARGEVRPRTVALAAGLALPVTVALSLALGTAAALAHLVLVAAGWAYNLVLKPTPVSPLPFLVAFGLLPAVATLAADPPAWPPVAVVAAGGLLGVAAHFANTVGDAEADAATGVRGLPQRLGPRASMVVMAAVVAAAAALLLVDAGTASTAGAVARAVLAAGVVLALASAVWALRRGAGAGAFRATLVAVALVVGGFLASG